MCFSKVKTPEVEIPAAISSPTPAPSPSAVSPTEATQTAEERRRKIANMRQGLMSTIKTSSQGITGAGADLSSKSLIGKEKLGK